MSDELVRQFREASVTNSERFACLVETIKAPQLPLGLFVGAGGSCCYGMPQWRQFLQNAARDLGVEPLIADGLERAAFDDVAELLSNHDPDGFERVIQQTFSRSNVVPELRTPTGLLPFLPTSLVVTTNFDWVLETVYEVAGKTLAPVLYGATGQFAASAIHEKCLPLLKIHGDYLHGRILTTSQYRQHYETGGDLFQYLVELFSTYSFLFFGTSLTDPHLVRALRESQCKGARTSHYAILARPAVDADLSLQDASMCELGIRSIWYRSDNGSHDMAASIVGWLINYCPGASELTNVSICRHVGHAYAARESVTKLLVSYPECQLIQYYYLWAHTAFPRPEQFSKRWVDSIISAIDKGLGIAVASSDFLAIRGWFEFARGNFEQCGEDAQQAIVLSEVGAPHTPGLAHYVLAIYHFTNNDCAAARRELVLAATVGRGEMALENFSIDGQKAIRRLIWALGLCAKWQRWRVFRPGVFSRCLGRLTRATIQTGALHWFVRQLLLRQQKQTLSRS